MRVVIHARRATEAPIVIRHELGEKRISILDARDTGEPKLFDESVLKRVMRALDTTFSRGRIGTNHIDIEVSHRASRTCSAFVIQLSSLGLVAEESRVVTLVLGFHIQPDRERSAAGMARQESGAHR